MSSQRGLHSGLWTVWSNIVITTYSGSLWYQERLAELQLRQHLWLLCIAFLQLKSAQSPTGSAFTPIWSIMLLPELLEAMLCPSGFLILDSETLFKITIWATGWNHPCCECIYGQSAKRYVTYPVSFYFWDIYVYICIFTTLFPAFLWQVQSLCSILGIRRYPFYFITAWTACRGMLLQYATVRAAGIKLRPTVYLCTNVYKRHFQEE